MYDFIFYFIIFSPPLKVSSSTENCHSQSLTGRVKEIRVPLETTSTCQVNF